MTNRPFKIKLEKIGKSKQEKKIKQIKYWTTIDKKNDKCGKNINSAD